MSDVHVWRWWRWFDGIVLTSTALCLACKGRLQTGGAFGQGKHGTCHVEMFLLGARLGKAYSVTWSPFDLVNWELWLSVWLLFLRLCLLQIYHNGL